MNTITVIGIGTSSSTPDVAYVEVGVDVADKAVITAFNNANDAIRKVISAVTALGIDPKDIQTTSLNVYTESNYNPQTGLNDDRTYRASNIVRVTVRDVSRAAEVLNAAVNAGANVVYGLNFSIADTSTVERDARVNAVANARARAEHLAQLMGVSLGDVVVVRENYASSGFRYEAAAYGLGGGGAGVAPGNLSVSVELQVTYTINK